MIATVCCLLIPLGSTELELNAQPGNVQLVDNKGQRYTADDAEEMIGNWIGMPIPLNSLLVDFRFTG